MPGSSKRRSAARPYSLSHRTCGILLHPTSLPGPMPSGDIGRSARALVDFLADAGQTWWQVLPIGPPGVGNSPYSAQSALAGSLMLISVEQLAADGLLAREDVPLRRSGSLERVDYPLAQRMSLQRLQHAFNTFMRSDGPSRGDFVDFCRRQRDWLDDWSLYAALTRYGEPKWTRWPAAIRSRDRAAVAELRRDLSRPIEFERFCQFAFDGQWHALKRYANERGIGLIGDIPIFVALDSADVWAHQELFDVQRSGRPRAVSGVPPDSFSPTGQLWGHPLYDWTAHERTGFAWWIARFRRAFEQFDAVRIDHFLGFHRCWAVPATARSAARGVWRKSPGRALFTALRDALGPVRIIAEDLGVVTPEAIALREQCGFPGMRIVQNAFGHAGHDDLPHNHPRDSVVYTGTHDNDTAVGWFAALPKGAKHGARGRDRLTARERFMRYSGSDGRAVHWDLIRLAYQSPARTAIIPMQDVLGLGGEARMNVPAVSRGNWGWRMRPGAIRTEHVRRLRELAGAFERLPCKCE